MKQVVKSKCALLPLSCLQVFLRLELNLVITFFMNTAGKSNIAAHIFVSNIALRITKLFYSSC